VSYWSGDTLTHRDKWSKCASLSAIIAFACALHAQEAQTYQLGTDTASSAGQPARNQAQTQSLGWGSNIQNARIARAAQLALQHGDYAHAAEYAERAAQSAPNDPQLWFLLGYAARLNSRYQQSVDAYNHGLQLSPGSLDGLSGLAQTYSLTGRKDDAERLLKQVLSSDPRRWNDALVLGDLYLRSADYSSALDSFDRAERIHPDARSELMIAVCYQHLNKMEMASRYLEIAKKHAPDNPEVQRSLAGYFRSAGRYSDAIAALMSIRAPKPDVIAELAYTYQLDGKLNDSAVLYAKAANAAQKNIALQLSAAQAQVVAGSIADASPFLQRAESLDPKHYRLHAIKGEIAAIQDKDTQAADEYEAAIANLPVDTPEGPLYRIQLHMDLMNLYKNQRNEGGAKRQLQIAQQQIDQLGTQGTTGAPFLRLRAQIKMNSGDLNGALTDIAAAVAADSLDPNGLQLNGDVLMKLGRTQEAIETYKKVLVIDSNNRFALTSLGYASRAAGDDKAAEKYFLRLAQADPKLYVPYLALGDLYTALGQFKEANASYEKAFALATKNALIVAGGMNAAIEAHNLDLAATWLSRSTATMAEEPVFLREKERYLTFKGEYRQSEAVGEEAIRLLPEDRDVVVYLGYDLLRLGRYDDLLGLTQKYINLLPKEPDIPLLMGYVHKHQGQSELARQDFTETLKRDPNIVTAYVNRGYMLNDLHQPDAAAVDFEAALSRNPNDGEANLGLAYADLDLHKPQAAIRHADLAEKTMGDSKNVHVIRATAFDREELLAKAATEYKAALAFDPEDASLYLGLANTLFSQRRYHDTIDELQTATKLSPEDAEIYALLARSYANLGERDQTLRYIQMAEQRTTAPVSMPASTQEDHRQSSNSSAIFISTGEAFSALGEQQAAMDRFRKALEMPGSNRVRVRLAIAQSMAQQGRGEEAEREIALALMEATAGDTPPPSASDYIAAADVFRSTHDYQLSQTYVQRAKIAGAPDPEVRIGLANNYLALGETVKANAELSAISTETDSAPSYQYLLAQANVYRQQHQTAQALTSFAEASNAAGDDSAVTTSLLQAGADEGLRVTPSVSVLSDFSVGPIFEDTTVYVLDSKLDAAFPVSSSTPSLLPPPRSSIEIQGTSAFHLHLANIPTPSGFFQVRNAQGQISVPATNSIVNRNTTDYTFNFGLNPTVHLGSNAMTFSGGVQSTIRRDSESPVQMNQNLFRLFAYVTTSSFFNALSMDGYIIREGGPFTESNLHSRALTAAINFRVGSPWGKNALLLGWGASDQLFTPTNYEDYFTSSYVGFQRQFSERLTAKAMLEDVRAWRVVGISSGIAQNVRPAARVDFSPKSNWNIEASSAFSSTRSFHIYDAIQNGIAISYARPFRRQFHDASGEVALQYPIRISAGVQTENFFNFPGSNSQQIRPYVQISLF
jgi:tetratricopeptide (TPR) repeat protein